MLKKIYQELILIRIELQAIRRDIKPKHIQILGDLKEWEGIWETSPAKDTKEKVTVPGDVL